MSYEEEEDSVQRDRDLQLTFNLTLLLFELCLLDQSLTLGTH
jgi:hypothetical protein